jgi:hypothetical protein
MGPILVKLNPEGFTGVKKPLWFSFFFKSMVLGQHPPDIKRKNDNFFEKLNACLHEQYLIFQNTYYL